MSKTDNATRYRAGNPEQIRKKSRKRIHLLMKELNLDAAMIHEVNEVLFPELFGRAMIPTHPVLTPPTAIASATASASAAATPAHELPNLFSRRCASPRLDEDSDTNPWEDGDWGSVEEDHEEEVSRPETGEEDRMGLALQAAECGWADCGYDGGVGKAGGADFGGDIGYDYDDDEYDNDNDNDTENEMTTTSEANASEGHGVETAQWVPADVATQQNDTNSVNGSSGF